MDDLISRQAAIDAILRNQELYSNNFGDDPIDKYTVAIIDNDAQTVAQLPSAEPTLYGYKVEHLVFIARVMEKENVTPEKVIEIMTDIGRVATIILAEQKRIIEQEVERWI